MKNHKLKKHTKAEQYAAITHIVMHGAKQKRKDGGVLTKPTIPCEDVPESEVLKNVISLCSRMQVRVRRNNIGKFYIDGEWREFGIKYAADLIGNIGPLYIEIECKRGKGGVWSKKQRNHAEKVRASGGTYIIVHSAEECRIMIEPLLPKDDLFGK